MVDYRGKIENHLKNEESITAIIKEIYTVARRDKCPHCAEEQEDVKIDKPVSIVEGNYKLTASEVRERLETIPDDDLTHKLVDILRINQRLKENMEAGAPQLIVEDLWELLQYHVTTYFDNEVAGCPPARHRSGRPLKTLSQRLKGKDGRF